MSDIAYQDLQKCVDFGELILGTETEYLILASVSENEGKCSKS